MPSRIGVGVIGVGVNWQRRYRPALARLRKLFRVHAVFDPAYDRAAAAAHELGCRVADNLTAMLETDAVQAVLLTGTGWYGLWPLEGACRHRKPFLCAAPMTLTDPRLAAFAEAAAPVPHVIDLPGQHGPAFERLRQLLAEQLGPPRLILGEWARPIGRRPGTIDPAELGLLSLAARLFNTEPEETVGTVVAGAGTSVRALDFGEGRRAVVLGWETAVPLRGARLRLRIESATGRADFVPPGRLCWVAGPDWQHQTTERFRAIDTPRLLLEQLARAVRGEPMPKSPLPLLARMGQWLAPLANVQRSTFNVQRPT